MKPPAPHIRTVLALTVAVGISSAFVTPAGAEKVVLVPYHTAAVDPAQNGPGFWFTVINPWDPVADVFFDPAYDGYLAWSIGYTPFFGGDNFDPVGYCPLIVDNGHTDWPVNTHVLLRFEVDLCENVSGLEVRTAIDNSVGVWVNGLRIVDPPDCTGSNEYGLCNSEGCAEYDHHIFEADDWMLQPGANVIAIRAEDHGIVSFLDFTVLADLSQQTCTHVVCDNATASVTELWPPNHGWKAVTIDGIVDSDGNPVTATITGVWQDEPTVGPGRDKCPDAMGVGTSVVYLRSERDGTGDGRVYHLSYTASIDSGETCTGVVTVCVPHDQGAGPNCVDGGALYDSTICQ